MLKQRLLIVGHSITHKVRNPNIIICRMRVRRANQSHCHVWRASFLPPNSAGSRAEIRPLCKRPISAGFCSFRVEESAVTRIAEITRKN